MPTVLRPLLATRPDLVPMHEELTQGLNELLCCDRPWNNPPSNQRLDPESRMRHLLARYSLRLRAELARSLLTALKTNAPR